MGPSAAPGYEPVLGDGHYTWVLAGAGRRTLKVNVGRSARHVRATTVHVASKGSP